MEAASTELTMESFRECCGSTQFATEMAGRMPFSSLDHAIDASRSIWWNQVNVPGWLEAFGAHPRIGDIEALKKKFPSDKGWAAGEQSAALTTVNENVLQKLAEWNKRYEAKFGFIFLICATGKDSHEMLAALKERFKNRAYDELKVAAQEQQKITELRLAKLDVWGSKESRPEEKISSERISKVEAHITGPALRPPITTHVLDVSIGRPGAGIDVKLERRLEGGGKKDDWATLGTSVTNSDGRCGQLMGNSNYVQAGTYRLTFETGDYLLRTQGGINAERTKCVFYPFVHVVFQVQPHQASEHFHVPLLFSPYSYTTYRGS